MGKNQRKGAGFEQQVADYLARETGLDIERRKTHGSKDTGDLASVYLDGERVVIECKNHKRLELSEWIDEAEAEAANDGAAWCFVVHKRRGCGEARMGKNYTTMTLEQLARILRRDDGHRLRPR